MRIRQIVMALQGACREFPLPDFDQEQGNGAGGMYGQARDTSISALAAVSVARMGAQGPDALDNRGESA
nr:hypothetical protein [Labrys sp. KNU-23]